MTQRNRWYSKNNETRNNKSRCVEGEPFVVLSARLTVDCRVREFSVKLREVIRRVWTCFALSDIILNFSSFVHRLVLFTSFVYIPFCKQKGARAITTRRRKFSVGRARMNRENGTKRRIYRKSKYFINNIYKGGNL